MYEDWCENCEKLEREADRLLDRAESAEQQLDAVMADYTAESCACDEARAKLRELAEAVVSVAQSSFYSQLSGEMHYMCSMCDSEDAPTWGMVDHYEDCPTPLADAVLREAGEG